MKKGIFKKASVIFIALLFVLSSSCFGKDNSDQAPLSSGGKLNLTSIELAEDMGNGWNLGNTMEAVADWLGSNATVENYENAWGQPTTTKAMIDGLKESGISSIRIPVAWSNMMSDDETYTINEGYFKRIDEIIGYVLDNNLYAVMNIHWDGGWWEDFGSEDESVRNAAMEKYTAVWTQLSEHYKKYSHKLIFESANEELGNATKGKFTDSENYENCTAINQKFVDIVRNSGGNNTDRYLLIAGYNTDIKNTCDSRFRMPVDTIENRLLISVHYYTPSTYCIASEEDNSWGYSASWGTEDDVEEMRSYFKQMTKFTEAGYGVIVGEYGVAEIKKDGKYVLKDGADKFVNSVVEISDEYGYCPMLWDCGAFYDRTEATFKDETIANIFKQ